MSRPPARRPAAALAALVSRVRADLTACALSLLATRPDTLVLGMSLESFLDDPDAESGRLGAALEARGVAFVDAGSALRAAFDALDVRRVGLLTPYRPEANAMVRRFFTEELGVEVVALRAVDCPTAHAIAEVPEDRLRTELTELARSEPQAIVQSGTNLSALRLADEAERRLGLPVLAINAVLWWRALRASGIADRRPGFGVLMRQH